VSSRGFVGERFRAKPAQALFGVAFIAGGIFMAVVLARQSFVDESELRRADPFDARTADSLSVGDRVTLEGRLGDQNPVISHGFVLGVK